MPTETAQVFDSKASETWEFMDGRLVTAIRNAHERVTELQKQHHEASQLAVISRSNSAVVTFRLQGRDPEAAAISAEKAVSKLASELSGAMVERSRLFQLGAARWVAARGESINASKEHAISPVAHKLQNLIDETESLIDQIVTDLQSFSKNSTKGGRLDSALVEWNRLCDECAGPSNARISPADGIGASIGAIVFQTTKEVPLRLTKSLDKLREAIAAARQQLK